MSCCFRSVQYQHLTLLSLAFQPGVQVDLAVAQIDMVYSQYAFIRLVAFLNEAYPPPNLDPLMVRTSVTLNEVVRERLIGQKQPHQVQVQQQSQPVIKVNNPTRLCNMIPILRYLSKAQQK